MFVTLRVEYDDLFVSASRIADEVFSISEGIETVEILELES